LDVVSFIAPRLLPPDGVLACWQSSAQKTAPAVAKQTAALSEAKIHRAMNETLFFIACFSHRSRFIFVNAIIQNDGLETAINFNIIEGRSLCRKNTW
jgi:hypothetical protein